MTSFARLYLVPWLMLLMASSVLAENRFGQVVINPAVTFQVLDGDRRPEDAEGIGLGLEFRLGSNWAIEVAAFESDARIETRTSDYEVDLLQYRVDGLYYLFSSGVVQPYLGFGFGNAEFDNVRESETQLNVGGGLRLNLTDAWSLRWDLRSIFETDDNYNDGMMSLGISYAFGGSAKSTQTDYSEPSGGGSGDYDGDGVADRVDRCPYTGTGILVDATGCTLDSDEDGVRDDADECPNTFRGTKVGSDGCSLDSDGDGVGDEADQCPGSEPGAIVDVKGCVGVKKAVAVETITLKIEFAVNSDAVDEKYYSEIRKVAGFLAAYSEVEVEIEGHSDSSGAAAYNKQLSQRRADAVKNVLVNEFGIDATRVDSTGYGEERPIASNETKQGQRRNRRVVAVIKREVLR